MNMGYQVGGATTVTLTPLLADRFGWTTAFAVAAGVCVLGAFAWLLVSPTRGLSQGSVATRLNSSTLPVVPGQGLVSRTAQSGDADAVA
jgi:ACS family glucarate transporter-like MFS transporter